MLSDITASVTRGSSFLTISTVGAADPRQFLAPGDVLRVGGGPRTDGSNGDALLGTSAVSTGSPTVTILPSSLQAVRAALFVGLNVRVGDGGLYTVATTGAPFVSYTVTGTTSTARYSLSITVGAAAPLTTGCLTIDAASGTVASAVTAAVLAANPSSSADGVRVVTEVSTASPPVVSVSFVGTLYDGLLVSVSAATPGSCTGYAGPITAATYTQVCVCGGGGIPFSTMHVSLHVLQRLSTSHCSAVVVFVQRPLPLQVSLVSGAGMGGKFTLDRNYAGKTQLAASVYAVQPLYTVALGHSQHLTLVVSENAASPAGPLPQTPIVLHAALIAHAVSRTALLVTSVPWSCVPHCRRLQAGVHRPLWSQRLPQLRRHRCRCGGVPPAIPVGDGHGHSGGLFVWVTVHSHVPHLLCGPDHGCDRRRQRGRRGLHSACQRVDPCPGT
jgi:hypothetical protein